jgi:predicted anti-sigma-YlaC factor YlaD
MGKFEACKSGEQISLLMSLALDGMLKRDDKLRLDRHLGTCASCQAEWEAMQQMSVMLEREPMVGPPLGFAVRVERSLEAQVQKRRRALGGLAVMTGALPLVGITVAAATILVLATVAWNWFGSMSSVQQSAAALGQVASGVALMGKGTSFFLGDLLTRYGPPLVLMLALGLAFLVGIWTWLFLKRPGSSRRNGFV